MKPRNCALNFGDSTLATIHFSEAPRRTRRTSAVGSDGSSSSAPVRSFRAAVGTTPSASHVREGTTRKRQATGRIRHGSGNEGLAPRQAATRPEPPDGLRDRLVRDPQFDGDRMIAPTFKAQRDRRSSKTLVRRGRDGGPKDLLQRKRGNGASSFVSCPPLLSPTVRRVYPCPKGAVDGHEHDRPLESGHRPGPSGH